MHSSACMGRSSDTEDRSGALQSAEEAKWCNSRASLAIVVAKVVELESASRHRIPVPLFASRNGYEALMLAFIQSLTLSSFTPVFALNV